MPRHSRITPVACWGILLAGCHGASFVQPEVAGAPPKNAASVEAVKWVGGRPTIAFEAHILRVWDSKGKKLFDGLGESYQRVALKPGAYEFQVKCESAKAFSPPRVGLRVDANQKFTLHCEPAGGDAVRVVARNLSDPARPGAKSP